MYKHAVLILIQPSFTSVLNRTNRAEFSVLVLHKVRVFLFLYTPRDEEHVGECLIMWI